jgi:alpha-1,3-rhamnosyl/mannosyltransferase
MKVLLNAIPLTGLLTGISRYLRNLYLNIQEFEQIEIEYFDGQTVSRLMPAQAEPDSWIQTTDSIWKLPDLAVVGLRAVHWLLYERRLRRVISNGDFHVYHETAFTPAAINQRLPQIFTLHDLSLMHYREYHPKERVWFSDLFFKRRLSEACHVIVPSVFIKNEVCQTLRLSEQQVTSIPEAPDPFFSPRPADQVHETHKRLSLPKDYLLFVGTLEPRKNLDLIIEALGQCSEDIALVLTGWKGWGKKPWIEHAARYGIENNIYMTGYVDEHSLACLYSGALALIYPSKYEGFGLPVLEAMACGCPVICSNAASLPEVAGGAAVYIDPQDATSLVQAIEQVVFDHSKRESLQAKGLQQASLFSWRSTAQKTVEVFEERVYA